MFLQNGNNSILLQPTIDSPWEMLELLLERMKGHHARKWGFIKREKEENEPSEHFK